MSFRFRLIFYMVFTVFFAHGQLHYAKFTNKITGASVPYCTVTSIKTENGAFADEFGIISLAHFNPTDAILISALGYEKCIKNLNNPDKIDNDTAFFYLIEKAVQLNEIDFRANKKVKTKKFDLGYFKNKEHLIEITGVTGRTNALFIPNVSGKMLKISKLLYAVEADEAATVRLQLFTKSTTGDEPSVPLINENLVVYLKKGQRNIIYDVGKYNVFMPENGVFIALQWLGKVTPAKKFKNVSPAINSHLNKNKDFLYYKFLDKSWKASESHYWAPNFGISVIAYN